MLLLRALVGGFVLTLGQVIWANDSSSADVNGTIILERQNDISMDKEALLISADEIRVAYVFTNNSKKDIHTNVTFPMPPIYFGVSDHSSIEDFKLWVNDAPLQVNFALVVKTLDGKDISKQFADSGWSAQDVANFVEDDIVPANKKPLPAGWFTDGSLNFTMSHYYTWQQHFPAGSSVAVRHAYRPSKSSGVPMPVKDLLAEFGKAACIDERTAAGIKKREDVNGVNWSFLQYILLTGNNWQGAIKDFELTIKKQHAEDLMSLCFDGDLKKVDPVTFKFQQKNFRPKQNLDILFVGKKSG